MQSAQSVSMLGPSFPQHHSGGAAVTLTVADEDVKGAETEELSWRRQALSIS